jgi:hypothetical protein
VGLIRPVDEQVVILYSRGWDVKDEEPEDSTGDVALSYFSVWSAVGEVLLCGGKGVFNVSKVVWAVLVQVMLGNQLIWVYGLHTVPVVEAARAGLV